MKHKYHSQTCKPNTTFNDYFGKVAVRSGKYTMQLMRCDGDAAQDVA